MRRFLGFICYSVGIVFYVLSGLVALLVIIGVGDVIEIAFNLRNLRAPNELVFVVRIILAAGVGALIFYWIGRLLTRDTLEDVWYRIRSFSR